MRHPAWDVSRARAALTDLFRVAIAAADPGPAVHQALARRPRPAAGLWLIALGKAAGPMAEAAVAWAREHDVAIEGGLVVPPAALDPVPPGLAVEPGDHPEPGPGSLRAASRLADLVTAIPPGADVLVLLSGGTTALVGAPLPGASPDDLRALYSLLLGSGLDITLMNRVRKRFTRWGGGKLALALEGRRVHCLVVSDVLGDDLPSIGSGPCVPDPASAEDVHRLLTERGLLARLPAPLVAELDRQRATEAGTPAARRDRYPHVETELIVSNRLAVEAIAARARAEGLDAWISPHPLAGEAADMAVRIVERVQSYARDHASQAAVLVWGGETTVTLPASPEGLGGRSQELALAAAELLDGREGLALLAGGTDGRDGPTDAAGGLVDGRSWAAMAAAGRRPAADLARHDAYHALDAIGALLKPGMTGTNVMDVVIGLCWPAGSPGRG